jgi:hypothetical protein
LNGKEEIKPWRKRKKDMRSPNCRRSVWMPNARFWASAKPTQTWVLGFPIVVSLLHPVPAMAPDAFRLNFILKVKEGA